MNLQVIVSGDGWVLDKHGKLLADAFGVELRTEPEPMPDGITYLMNYAQVRKLGCIAEPIYGKTVAMLTHFEPSMAHLWERACYHCAALVPMSKATAEHIPLDVRHKATVIPLPVPDYIAKRKPRIGIAGIRNPTNEHRKGWDLVDRLRAEHPEWEIVSTGGNLSEPEMLDWYRSLDVYLCPSRYEGGPMGVIEAAAMGVHVVCPWSVGWCHGIGFDYDAGDYDSMAFVVSCVVSRNCKIGGSARYTNGTGAYIEAHRKLFAALQ